MTISKTNYNLVLYYLPVIRTCNTKTLCVELCNLRSKTCGIVREIRKSFVIYIRQEKFKGILYNS